MFRPCVSWFSFFLLQTTLKFYFFFDEWIKNLSDFYSKSFLDFFSFLTWKLIFLFFCFLCVINSFSLILVLALLWIKNSKNPVAKFFNFFLDLILDEEKLKNYWKEIERKRTWELFVCNLRQILTKN